MSGDRQLLAAGVTTVQFAVGISAISRFTLGQNVLGIDITHVSGGTLYMLGQSVAVATGVSTGVFIPSTGIQINGNPDLYFVAAGAATTVHISRRLGSGFNGQY